MTTGEKAICETIKDNLDTFEVSGKILIEIPSTSNKKQFTEALKSLKAKGYITYEISFLSVIVKLTTRGRQKLDANGLF